MRLNWITCVVLGSCLASGCSREPSAAPPAGTPKLVVLIVVDQLGGEHLARFDSVFEGGFRRLLDEGVSFAEAHHEHAITHTAPGHASIATGCYPSEHGIISNYWIDRATGERVYSVDDERHEISGEDDEKGPARLECSAIGDWLKDRYPESRVFAMSRKDRSAVLMGGHRADGAYWYGEEGAFVSSSYYPRSKAPWLEEFNSEGFLESNFGQVWEALTFEPERLDEMEVVSYDLGPLEEDFPHVIGGLSLAADENFFWDARSSPWMDDFLLRLARRAVSAERLGKDVYPDLLAIGFSTSDTVGHEHGPDSREFFDVLARLDRRLGEFFEFLDQAVGLGDVVVVLTSDHGSVPIPELRAVQGLPGARAGADEVSCFQGVESTLDQELGEARWLLPGPFLAPLPADARVSRDELLQRTKVLLEQCPSVARVWLAGEVSREGPGDMQRKFAHSYFPERSADFAIEWDEFFLPSRFQASSHGTPHRYDTHVPLIFWRRGVAPVVQIDPVRTVDIAPTLASWVGVDPPESISGRSLADLMDRPGAP